MDLGNQRPSVGQYDGRSVGELLTEARAEVRAREAHLLGRLGDESSLDVRRAKAAGAMARRDLALDLLIADEDTGEVIAEAPGRRVELNRAHHRHLPGTGRGPGAGVS